MRERTQDNQDVEDSIGYAQRSEEVNDKNRTNQQSQDEGVVSGEAGGHDDPCRIQGRTKNRMRREWTSWYVQCSAPIEGNQESRNWSDEGTLEGCAGER